MGQNMRDFTYDLESRLDRVYKSGAQGKYGYNRASSQGALEENDGGQEKRINKLANQA